MESERDLRINQLCDQSEGLSAVAGRVASDGSWVLIDSHAVLNSFHLEHVCIAIDVVEFDSDLEGRIRVHRLPVVNGSV